MRIALALSFALVAGCSHGSMNLDYAAAETATPEPPGPNPTPNPYGDGHDGDFTLTAGSYAPNRCFPVITASAMTARLDTAEAIAAGTSLLFQQVTADLPNASGDRAAITDSFGAGRAELVRAAADGVGTITLAAALAFVYESGERGAAQACTVPEWASLDLGAGAALVAKPWDGTSGGVLAILVAGAANVEGALDVSATGFRGGAHSDAVNTFEDEGDLDVGDLARAGEKGEGLDAVTSSTGGRGNAVSGAGGGNTRNSGGGGGGGAGEGGRGGNQGQAAGALEIGGFGGAQIAIANASYFFFGGGGGGGHRSENDTATGAAGGGVLMLRTAELTGAGRILAAGAAGAESNNTGAGGGGAGGTISVAAGASAFTGTIAAHGGRGGDTRGSLNRHGPGGGGGGGWAFTSASVASVPDVAGGASGVNPNFDDDPYGADPGAGGVVTTLSP